MSVEGKYSVELFKEGGEGASQEEIIDRHDNLTVARADLSRPRFPISGPTGHAKRSCSRSGEKRPTRDDAVRRNARPRARQRTYEGILNEISR